MTRIAQLLLVAGAATILAGCRDSTGPAACTKDTNRVSAAVTGGSSLSFDWQPRCAVALLLVEEVQHGEDQWGAQTPESTWSDANAANRILPPVQYGVLPAGTEEVQPPTTLVPGQAYHLVLWRVIPPGGTVASCQMTLQGMCLLAVQPFTR